jgi:gamma-glutamyltranspeptidase/glutathione hydrolase
LAWLLLLPGPAAATNHALGIPGVQGGVVATSEPHAARAGAEILQRGGNAVDAAAAVAFALGVVEPQSSGLGGGAFMVIHLANENRTVTVDARETAPAAATPDQFMPFVKLGDRGQAFELASTSGIAVGVPGLVRGVELALNRWGSLSFSEVLQPAIRLAEEGFYVGPRLAESVHDPRLATESGVAAWDTARAVFHPGGEPVGAGDLLRQPALARTLKILAEQGPDAFYEGEIAAAIVATQRAARNDMPAGRGRMTEQGLAGYRAKVRPPVRGEYRGYDILGMGPPSSGGITVAYIAGLLERFPLGNVDAGFGFGSVRTLNVMTEAMRIAYADRALWMGDADFVPVPVEGLLSEAYIERRSALINPDRRRKNVEASDPRPYDRDFAGQQVALAATAPSPGGTNTTHFTVVDRHGNVVSVTSTIESAWGTGLMVPGYGFLLNNELTDFNFIPAASADPNAYNPGANDVAPGKRPRSSMAPTIVLHDGEPIAAWGSPGGSTIINTVLNVALNLIDHDMGAQSAVDAPRLSVTSADGEISREAGFERDVIKALEAIGHTVETPEEIGSVQLVVIDPATGLRYGAADRRRVGSVQYVPVER